MKLEDSEINDWTLTQLGGDFSLWCALFHSYKYWETKDDGQGFTRHRCKKCKVVFLRQDLNY